MAAGRILLPCMPALDSNGRPVAGAELNFYQTGTTIRQSVYTTADLDVELTNPVVADAAGAFPSIFADDDELYSVTGFSPAGVMLPKASYSSVRATTAIGDGLVVVSSYMQTVLDDTTASAAQTTLDVYSKSETRERIDRIRVEDYYSGGAIPYVSTVETSAATRAAAPQIDTALAAAIVAAQARINAGTSSAVELILPNGMMNIGTVVLPANITLRGSGNFISTGSTWLRVNGSATANGICLGIAGGNNSVVNAHLHDVLVFRDHGANGAVGITNPAGAFSNAMTGGALVIATNGYLCSTSNVSIYNGSTGFAIRGGFRSHYEAFVSGCWDLTDSDRQETVYGVLVAPNPDTPNASIPTFVSGNFLIGGDTLTGQTLNYPGGHSQVSTLNIGPQYGLAITCAEECYFDVNVSAVAKSDVLFLSASGRIIQDVQLTGSVDPCGVTAADACVKFEYDDTGGQCKAITLDLTCNGQLNNRCFVSDTTAAGTASLATYGSVNGLTIKGVWMNVAGPGFELTNARNVVSTAAVMDYNHFGWYTGKDGAGYAISTACNGLNIGGVIGSSIVGATASSPCKYGVWTDSASASNVKVTAQDGGCSVALHANGGSGAPLPYYNALGLSQMLDVNQTFIWGTNGALVVSLFTITASRDLTLSDVDYKGRAVPDGAVCEFAKIGSGFTVVVKDLASGGTLATYSAGQGGRFVFYSGNWRLLPN